MTSAGIVMSPSSSSVGSAKEREALLETLRGSKVRTALSQLFPRQCGVIAQAPIMKGEPVFPCNGKLSNDVVDLTFEEVASLPEPSRKLVLAFFQPNEDPRSVPREELTFPVPVNGLIHVGTSFFCNSADGTGLEANVETGSRIDGSGYAELTATRDIQVGEELLDSYPIWNYGFGGEGDTVSGGNNVEDASTELLAIAATSDEAQDILDLRRHVATLKEKVARLEQEKEGNEGNISGLKRQADCAAFDNRRLRAKVARLTDLGKQKDEEIARKDKKIAKLKTSLYSSFSFQGYRDSSSTEAETESEEDNDFVDMPSFDPNDVAIFGSINSGAVHVDLGPLSLHEVEVSGGDTEDNYDMNQDDVDFPPLPPLPGGAVEIAEGTLDATDHESQNSRGAIGAIDPDSDSGNEASSGGSCKARPHVGIANPNNNQHMAKWNYRYVELFDYKKAHGHCNVPKNYGPNKQLANWVKVQRAQYRLWNEGKTSCITTARIATLNEIGFVWYDPQTSDVAWVARFEELVEYKEKHGHCNAPTKCKPLGSWVREQRTQYRFHRENKKTRITEERIAKLNDIGFEWDASHLKRNEGAWEARLAELVKYKEVHGDCIVLRDSKENQQLGWWVHTQRTQYRFYREGKKSQITDDRIGKLNGIDFEWDGQLNKGAWEAKLAQLVAYKEEHGDCNVSTLGGANKQLGNWVAKQRQEYRLLNEGNEAHIHVMQERIAKLNEIGFEWDANEAAWEAKLEELVEYKAKHGDCNVPSTFKENKQLGEWVAKQRYYYRNHRDGKKSQISNERIAKLNEIGFKWRLK